MDQIKQRREATHRLRGADSDPKGAESAPANLAHADKMLALNTVMPAKAGTPGRGTVPRTLGSRFRACEKNPRQPST
jgi:hypothetical protein